MNYRTNIQFRKNPNLGHFLYKKYKFKGDTLFFQKNILLKPYFPAEMGLI